MNSLALSVLGIDGFTFAAIVILIKFNVNLLDCSQASWRDLSASILVFVMIGGLSSFINVRSSPLHPVETRSF